MGRKGRGKRKSGGEAQDDPPGPESESSPAVDPPSEPLASTTPLPAEREPGQDPDMAALADAAAVEMIAGVAPALRQSERQLVNDTERGQRAVLRMDEEDARRALYLAFRQGRPLAEEAPTQEQTPPVLAAVEPDHESPAADTVNTSASLSTPIAEPLQTQVFSPPTASQELPQQQEQQQQQQQQQQEQQQEQSHRLYGAAARPVESASEALDRANATSTHWAGPTVPDDGGGAPAGVEDPLWDRTSHSAGGGGDGRGSTATRRTHYGTMPYDAIAAARGAAGASSLQEAPRSPSPTTARLRRCEAEAAEVQRSKLFFWPLVVAPPLSYDEQQEEAFYLPFRDTHFYCYSLEEELAALRAITVEEAAEAAAQGALCTPAAGHGERVFPPPGAGVAGWATTTSLEDVTAAARSPATSDAWRGNGSAGTPRGQEWSISMQLATDVNGGVLSDVHRCGGGHAHRYHVPQLRRLWATAVLRQLLLFTFSGAVAVALFAPMVVCGSLLDVYVANGHGRSFFSSRNRFSASAALSAVEVGAAGATLLALALAGVTVARLATQDLAPGQVVHPASAAALALWPRLVLVAGATLSAAGANLLFYAGVESRAGVAVLAKLLSGAGGGLAVGGLSTLASAEVGIAAGMIVASVVVLTAWLVATAANFFILPFVLDSWVTPTTALHGVAMLATTSLVFAPALALLMPGDMLTRAAVVNTPYLAPAALIKAAKEVSPRFLLRALSFSMLCAALLCMAVCATPLMSQRGLSGGASELVPVDPRHVASFAFIAALSVWPFCLVPTSAAWVNRLLPSALLTTTLAGLWLLYALLDPPSTLTARGGPAGGGAEVGGEGLTDSRRRAPMASMGGSGEDRRAAARGGVVHTAATPSTLARVAAHVLTPTVLAIATGLTFAVVASSVLRSMANAGATLPIHPTHRRRRTHRPRPVDEASALLSDRPSPRSTSAASGGGEGGESEGGGGYDTDVDCTSIRARFLFQRRGGPSAVLLLVLALAMTCSIVCTLSQAAVSALLVDLFHRPRNPMNIAEGVRLDVHESLLWVMAGLTGLAAFFDVLEVVFVMQVNVHRHHMEV